MEINRKNLVEGVGIVALILSLLFVAFQIQQANSIAIVTNEIELRNGFGAFNETIMSDPDLADLIIKFRDPNPELSETEELRALMWAYRLLNLWLASETAYKNNMLPQESYDVVMNDISGVFPFYPGAHQFFQIAYDTFPGWHSYDVYIEVKRYLDQYQE